MICVWTGSLLWISGTSGQRVPCDIGTIPLIAWAWHVVMVCTYIAQSHQLVCNATHCCKHHAWVVTATIHIYIGGTDWALLEDPFLWAFPPQHGNVLKDDLNHVFNMSCTQCKCGRTNRCSQEQVADNYCNVTVIGNNEKTAWLSMCSITVTHWRAFYEVCIRVDGVCGQVAVK